MSKFEGAVTDVKPGVLTLEMVEEVVKRLHTDHPGLKNIKIASPKALLMLARIEEKIAPKKFHWDFESQIWFMAHELGLK